MNTQKCSQCGLVNFAGAIICKRCGINLNIPIAQKQRMAYPVMQMQTMPPMQNNFNQPSTFRCPYCQSNAGYIARWNVSNAGWVIFVLLLLFCFVLCWIGFLITETHQFCRNCNMKLS